MGRIAITVYDQLKKHVVSDSGCWEFTGARDKNGYGVFGFKQRRAHRASYEFYVGPIPIGIFVCHTCDNPCCINPKHLFLGTPRDNMIDKSNKGRTSRLFGERNPMAKLTDDQRREIVSLHKSGETYSDIAKKYSVAFQTVGKIVKKANYVLSK